MTDPGLSIGDGIAIASAAYLLRFWMQQWSNGRAIKILAESIKAAVKTYTNAQK